MEKIENIEIKKTRSFEAFVNNALEKIISNPELDSVEIEEVGQRIVRCGTDEEQAVLDDEMSIVIPVKKDGKDFLIVAD